MARVQAQTELLRRFHDAPGSFAERVDAVLGTQELELELHGVTALGFRDEVRAVLAVKARDGLCSAIGFFENTEFVLSSGEPWPDTKFHLVKHAFMRPMTQHELAGLHLFEHGSLDELLTAFRDELARRQHMAVPAVFRG